MDAGGKAYLGEHQVSQLGSRQDMLPDSPQSPATAGARFPWVTDLLLLIVLLLAGIVFTAGLDRVVDLGLYDESKYLAQGLAAPAAWPGAQQAPLYAVWYLVLSWLQPDAVKLYYLDYLVVTCLLPLALFVALRSYRVGRAAAFLLALGLLLCRANLRSGPRSAMPPWSSCSRVSRSPREPDDRGLVPPHLPRPPC